MPPIYISKAVSSRKPQSQSCKDIWQNNKNIYAAMFPGMADYGRHI